MNVPDAFANDIDIGKSAIVHFLSASAYVLACCSGEVYYCKCPFGLATEPVILRYDPHHQIDSEAWQALDESERIELVRQYHRRNRIRLPNENLHAMTHVIVENQVALGNTFPARAVLLRLMEEGLDRHEAVHAIGSVLSEQLFVALREEGRADLNAQYVEKLNRLTAESWRKQAP